MISRTTMSAVQSAPTAAATSDSSARRAPSRLTLCPPLCVVLRAARLNTLPRNPCSNVPVGRLWESLATSDGKSSRYDLRQRTPPPGVSVGTVQSKSNACWLFSRQMTRVHPTPTRDLRLPLVSQKVRATALLFLIHAVTVFLETPKVRDSPRKLLRSS